MALPFLCPRSATQQLFICRRCLLKQTIAQGSRRSISEGWIRKKQEAEEAWKQKARKIDAGEQKSMLSILEERGFINAIAGKREDLDKLMIRKRVGVYVGVDPTARSLHVGHLLPFMVLFWMYLHGFHSISLLGGATAKIGDPTDRTTDRTIANPAERSLNMAGMHIQIKRLWLSVEAIGRRFGYERKVSWRRGLRNNNEWQNKLPITEFLRDIGKGMRMGSLLSRDSVKTKMASPVGMSFAEFTYPLLQAWDWWELYHTLDIQLQVGGSDQFGNIVTGIDAVNYIRKTHHSPDLRQTEEDPLRLPMGFTVPLLTTASGEKFGKSAGNAIWLDKELTSPFDLYQFFVRTADADVERYLKLFTFFPLPYISRIMAVHNEAPHKRIAQHFLAREFVELVHGYMERSSAEQQHHIIFGNTGKPFVPITKQLEESTGEKWVIGEEQSIVLKPPPAIDPTDTTPISASLNEFAPQVNWQNAPSPHMTLPRSLVIDKPFASLLWSAGLVKSKSEGNRLVQSQGAYVGGAPAQKRQMPEGELKWTATKSFDRAVSDTYLINGELLLLRVGKWNIRVIKVVSDEEYEASGEYAPGWTGMSAEGIETKPKRSVDRRSTSQSLDKTQTWKLAT
ncbi:tyrosyl-tRNA synthetase [Patellaria atrata CBS 101060]|uniref:Tyrosine--tRNA ligase n=1 Tax=Patellaria atrata CBS 101060 TaxID=1346257 RepID=A0A9P4VP60_9PEZI|nr:tyrosyl-tRNA synthetase [Patellaria atrata CBS 101060]